jgi:hypothetical protein
MADQESIAEVTGRVRVRAEAALNTFEGIAARLETELFGPTDLTNGARPEASSGSIANDLYASASALEILIDQLARFGQLVGTRIAAQPTPQPGNAKPDHSTSPRMASVGSASSGRL